MLMGPIRAFDRSLKINGGLNRLGTGAMGGTETCIAGHIVVWYVFFSPSSTTAPSNAPGRMQ